MNLIENEGSVVKPHFVMLFVCVYSGFLHTAPLNEKERWKENGMRRKQRRVTVGTDGDAGSGYSFTESQDDTAG